MTGLLPSPEVFCLDTGALVNPWRKQYPIDIFPSFWEKLEEWAKAGRLIAPEEVKLELEEKDDELLEWVRKHLDIFEPPTEAVQRALREVLEAFPRLVDSKKGRSAADAWVIAQAQVSGAIVVTEEQAGGGKSPKIPDVCAALRIPYANVLDLIRAMGLRF